MIVRLEDTVKLCLLAYQINDTDEKFDTGRPCFQTGIRVLKTNNDLAICAMTTDNKLCISIRGTDSTDDWKDNIDIKPVRAFYNGIKLPSTFLHSGFNKHAHELLPLIIREVETYGQESNIYLSGHSLGGAVAPIIGFYLYHIGFTNLRITTFGAPKFCTMLGAKWFNKIHYLRVVNVGDPVPLLPPGLFYIHCENMYDELLENGKHKFTDRRSFLYPQIDCIGLCCVGKELNINKHDYNEYVKKIELMKK